MDDLSGSVAAAARLARCVPGLGLSEAAHAAGVDASVVVAGLLGLGTRGGCAAKLAELAVRNPAAAVIAGCPPPAAAAALYRRAEEATRGRDLSPLLMGSAAAAARYARNHAVGGLWCPVLAVAAVAADNPSGVGLSSRDCPPYLLEQAVRSADGASDASKRRGFDHRQRAKVAAANISCPQTALVCAARSTDPGVRVAVAENPALPPRTRRRLLQDTDRDVRSAAIRSPRTAARTLARFSRDDSADVRRAVARHPTTRPEILTRLAADTHPDVRAGVASNPACPPELLAEILKRHPGLIHDAASSPVCPPQELTRHARHVDSMRRLKIAANLACPSTVLETLADDNNGDVRHRVAANPSCPPRLSERLAGDENHFVRYGAAQSKTTPRTVLARLCADPNRSVSAAALTSLARVLREADTTGDPVR